MKHTAPATREGEGGGEGKIENRQAGVPERSGVALLPKEMGPAASNTAAAFPAEPPPSAGAHLHLHVAPPIAASAGVIAQSSAADPASDEALVAALRRGDPLLGKVLYKRLVRVVDSTLTRVLGRGAADHADLIQAVFEEVVRTIRSGQFEMRCSLTSWAATIACHVGLNAIRTRRMERRVFDHDPQSEAPGDAIDRATDPTRMLDARDELRQLRVALAEMPEGRAEAILLHDALGYSLGEIAASSGSSVAAVQSRLVRGRRDLQDRLASSIHEEERRS